MPRLRLGHIVGGLSLLFCFCLPAAAPADLSGQAGWEATLAVSATTVLPAEPVLVTATLKYAEEDSFFGYAGFGKAGVTCTGSSGEQLSDSFEVSPFAAPAEELPPAQAALYRAGFTQSATSLVLYGAAGGKQGFIFEAAGTHDLVLHAALWQGSGISDYQPLSVASAPMTVTVLPLPAEESAAYALWHDEQVARMFLTGEAQAETQAKVKRLATSFPKSAYAKYALMALASQQRYLRDRLGAGPLPPQQREKAARLAAQEVALLERVHQQYGPFHLTPAVLYQLLTAARWLPDPERQDKLAQYGNALLALADAPEMYREDVLQTMQALGGGFPRPAAVSAQPAPAAATRSTGGASTQTASASRPAPAVKAQPTRAAST